MAVQNKQLWSAESCKIAEVVEREILPVMVRVTEGIYGATEAETFSQGDLLMLHKVLTISKVVACFVDGKSSGFRRTIKEDNYGYIEKEEILIPLGYKGRLTIFCPDAGHKVFNSVKQLIKDLPRFVRVIEQVRSTDDTILRRNDTLELDRYLPSQGLVCKWKDNFLCLSENTGGQFLLLPDTTEYTLQDVINKFPFPQFVTFLDEEFPLLVTKDLQEAVANITSFEGQALKLLSLRSQQTIIGHHKQAESIFYKTPKDVGLCKRTVVLIPLDSEAATDIDVNTPIDNDDEDYEMMQAMNFSKSSVEEENFDGTLYLELVKQPKVFMYEELPTSKNHFYRLLIFWYLTINDVIKSLHTYTLAHFPQHTH